MPKLEKAAYISIMVVSAVAVYSLVSPQFNWRASTLAKPSETALVGKVLNLTGIPWEQSRVALVLVITSHCPYCLRSLPLYRKLNKLAQDGNQGVSLFVVSPESIGTIEAFLSDEQIKPRKILHSSLAEMGVGATPTLLIVDQSGTVRHVFVGQLDEKRQRQLMDSLSFKASAAPVQDVSAGIDSQARRAGFRRVAEKRSFESQNLDGERPERTANESQVAVKFGFSNGPMLSQQGFGQ